MDPEPKYKLKCIKCGTVSEHIQMNLKAWNGWQITPDEICPQCIDKALRDKGFEISVGYENGKAICVLRLIGVNA